MENINSGYVKKRKSFSPKKQILDKDQLFLVKMKHQFLRDSKLKFQQQINELKNPNYKKLKYW